MPAVRPVILMVEDHPGFRRIYRELLENAGYELVEAEDGASGYELARMLRPDLILLDLVMPVCDGFELLHRLRGDEVTAGIPVIVFSVMGEPDDIQRAYRLGADDYTVKCLDSSDDVLAKIARLSSPGVPDRV